MDEMKFMQNIKKLYDYGKKFAYFEENSDKFLLDLSKIEINFLEEQKQLYFESSIDKNLLRPVNFIRYLILDKILKKEKIDIKILEDIIENVKNKNSDYFKDYPEFKSAVNSQKGKDPFKNWNNFRILFQIYYNFHKSDIVDRLKYIANEIEHEILKTKFKRKISSFDGNNYYGRSHCWLALYPLTKKNHQYAFQYFLSIYPDKGITFGLVNGKYVKGEFTGRIKKVSDFDFHEFINYMSALKNDFIEKNNNIILVDSASIETGTIIDDTEDDVDKEKDETPLNLILYGPPGTGKTIKAIEKAVKIIEPSIETDDFEEIMKKYKEFVNQKLISFVTFHQSYSYEEFIEGYRYNEEEKIPKPEPGLFKKYVDDISNDSKKHVFIIDEINRGNISNIFGEIITIIEKDKRKGGSYETEIKLPYSHENFSIPNNLYIIGTMNTADRSIALLDMALRRRFEFEEILPNKKLIEDSIKEYFENADDWKSIVDIFDLLNKRIEILLDKDHTIGHSYFMGIKNTNDLYNVWYTQIIPLLKEYFYNDWTSLKKILGAYKEKNGAYAGFVKDLRKEYKDIFMDGSIEEFPCEIVNYEDRKDEFLDILRTTFLKSQ